MAASIGGLSPFQQRAAARKVLAMAKQAMGMTQKVSQRGLRASWASFGV